MKSINSFTLAAAALLFGATHATAEPIPFESLASRTAYNALTYEGCYSSSSGLSLNTSYIYNTKGYCQEQCVPAGYSVQATTEKTECYCGNSLPPKSDMVDDTNCNAGCAGYDSEDCGSADGAYLSVYLTGSGTVDSDESASSSTSASSAPTTTSSSSAVASKTPSTTTSATPSVVTVGGQTIVVTASSSADTSAATPSAVEKSSGGGASKAGIAAGVVVGVIAIAAIAGGAYFFIRNKKRREVEEEYKRNAAVSSFIAGGKPPTSSAGDSFNDTRLDPVMAQRRMSDGSIADNQDYSRRILKVTNA